MTKNQGLTATTVMGLAALSAGFAWADVHHDPMRALPSGPFLLVAVGFTLTLAAGGLMQRDLRKAMPSTHEEFDIERNDERNRMLAAASKARAFDFATFALPALILILAALRASTVTVVALALVYVSILITALVARARLNTEN